MSRHVTFFSYTPEAWARLIDNPADRSGPVGATIAELGGRLESLGSDTAIRERTIGPAGARTTRPTPDSLIAAGHVVAVEFQTIAAANNYWRDA